MKTFLFKIISLFTALFFISGCCSTNLVVSKSFNGCQLTEGKSEPVAHINCVMYGYYIFRFFPIVTSDPDSSGVVFFDMPLEDDDAVNLVTQKAKELGADATVDVGVVSKGSWLFEKNTIIAPLWLCVLMTGGIWIEEIHVSANAVKVKKN